MYAEDDLLPLSALQHLVFCERQCALIHVEQLWSENVLTAEGRILHERAHRARAETRSGVRIELGMPLRSLRMGVSGKADSVEFHPDGRIFPVEYKRGRPKARNMDEIQLCAQAMCLEELRGISIAEGAIFYGKKRRRKNVVFDEALRRQTDAAAARVHELVEKGSTPPPVLTEACERCSLKHLCLPETVTRNRDVDRYVSKMLAKELGAD